MTGKSLNKNKREKKLIEEAHSSRQHRESAQWNSSYLTGCLMSNRQELVDVKTSWRQVQRQPDSYLLTVTEQG